MLHGYFKAIEMVSSVQWYKHNDIKKDSNLYQTTTTIFPSFGVGMLPLERSWKVPFPLFPLLKNTFVELPVQCYFNVIWHESNNVNFFMFYTEGWWNQ